MLTKKMIAEQSGISVGSVKYYITQFDEYFPGQKARGSRWLVYDDSAVEKIQIIAGMIGNYDHDSIRTKLNEKGHEPIYEGQITPHDNNKDVNMTKTIIKQEKVIDSLLQVIEAQEKIIDRDSAIIDRLELDIARLQNEIKNKRKNT